MGRLLRLAVFAGLVLVALALVHEGLRMTAQGGGGMATRAAATCASCHGG